MTVFFVGMDLQHDLDPNHDHDLDPDHDEISVAI